MELGGFPPCLTHLDIGLIPGNNGAPSGLFDFMDQINEARDMVDDIRKHVSTLRTVSLRILKQGSEGIASRYYMGWSDTSHRWMFSQGSENISPFEFECSDL